MATLEDNAELDSKAKLLQDRILSTISEDPSQYDARDVVTAKRDLWYCSQFMKQARGNEELAYERMSKSLLWRKSYGVNDLSFESLDTSLLETGIAFDRGVDRNGSKIVILNIRMHKKDPIRSQSLQRIMVFSLEQHFWRVKDQKIVMFFDMSETGLSNMDLEMVRFVIQLFSLHYPNTLSYLIVYKLPWILNAAWTIIKSWLSEAALSKMKFVNETTVTDYIDPSNLLLRYGGKDTWQFQYSPDLYLRYLSVEEGEVVDGEEERNGDGESDGERDGDDSLVTGAVENHFISMEEVDPDGSGEGRDSEVMSSKKQVRFDDSSYQGTTHRPRFSGDENSNIRRRQVEKILTMQGAVPKRTQSAGPVLEDSMENSFDRQSRLLGLNPSRELVFSRSSGGERRCSLTITNQHPATITYKIKTTAPNRYRVRPNISSLEASQSIKIQIQLTDQDPPKGPVSSDKFLIQACVLTDTAKDLTMLWKGMSPSAVEESVLYCRLDEAPVKPTSKKHSSTKHSSTKTHHSIDSKPTPGEPKSISQDQKLTSKLDSVDAKSSVVSGRDVSRDETDRVTGPTHPVDSRALEQQVSKLLLVCQELQFSVVRVQRITMATLACLIILFICVLLLK